MLDRSISDPLGRAGDQFRRFLIDDAHYWLAEYHIDSLRLDVRAIRAIAVHGRRERLPASVLRATPKEFGETAPFLYLTSHGDPALARP